MKLKLSPNVTVRRTQLHEAPDRKSEIPCDESDSDVEEASRRFFADEGPRCFRATHSSDEYEDGRYEDAEEEDKSPSKSERNAPFSTRTPLVKKSKLTRAPFSTPTFVEETSYDSIEVGIPRVIGLFQSPASLPTPSRLASTKIPSALRSSSTLPPRNSLPSSAFRKTTSFPSKIPLPSTPSLAGRWPAGGRSVGRDHWHW